MNRSILFLLVLLAACSVKLHTAYDRQVDFSGYKTFCWMDGCEFTITGPEYLNDEKLRTSLKQSIIAELQKKGLRYSDNNPDLLIDFHITLTEESAIIHHGEEEGPVYYRPLTESERITYLNGTLVIDMADRQKGQMVWRSVANGYMDTHPELTEENLRKGIRAALRKFPPKSEP